MGSFTRKSKFCSLSKQGYKYCLIITLVSCICCVYVLTNFNPNTHFIPFALCLVAVAFFSSIYDMLLQSSQMLLITNKNWGISEAACTTGFRIGILIAGSGRYIYRLSYLGKMFIVLWQFYVYRHYY